MSTIRFAKGALVVAGAAAVCHGLMSVGYGWAREAHTRGGDALFSGAFEFLLTMAASWVLMPLLLWAGMRLAGESGNVPLVVVGGFAWAMISGYFTDDIDQEGGYVPVPALLLYVLLGAASAGIGTRGGRSPVR